MPGFDGTGPRGIGPMTGGGRGFCALPFSAERVAYWRRPAYPMYGPPRGIPYYGAGISMPFAAPYAPEITREQELNFLRDQAEAMIEELEMIDARIKELESNKEENR